MVGFRNLGGVPPRVAVEVRERLRQIVLPERGERQASQSPAPALPYGSAPAPAVPDPGSSTAADRGTEDALSESSDNASVRGGLRRAHLVVVALLLVLAVAAALLVVVWRQPATQPLPLPSVSAGPTASALVTGEGGPRGPGSADAAASRGGQQPSTPRAGASASPGRIVVHVAGKVREPGVVRLPASSRVLDAIEEAGGARSGVELDTLNLARPLRDGEQLLVGVDATARPAAPGPAPGAAPSEPAPIDLNTATLDQLEQMPGIGPTLGQRILDFRAEHGGFTAVEQLYEVSGIGESTYADLVDRVVVR